MASACALAMFSGRIIFIFGIAERLRAFRYPIFTGEERNSNWQLPRWFPTETSARRAGSRSPERADFPRPGEDVTAGDKKGNLSRSD